MAHCPSHDWDAHNRQQDETIAADLRWWDEHKDRVLAMVSGLYCESNAVVQLKPDEVKVMVDNAAMIVREVINRTSYEW